MDNFMKPSTLQSFDSFGDLSYVRGSHYPSPISAVVPGTILAISGQNELRQSITIIPFPSGPGLSAKDIKTRSKFRCQSPYCVGEAWGSGWDGQPWPPQSVSRLWESLGACTRVADNCKRVTADWAVGNTAPLLANTRGFLPSVASGHVRTDIYRHVRF